MTSLWILIPLTLLVIFTAWVIYMGQMVKRYYRGARNLYEEFQQKNRKLEEDIRQVRDIRAESVTCLLNSVDFLAEILKIEPTFADNPDGQMLVRSLIRILHGLNQQVLGKDFEAAIAKLSPFLL